MTLKNAIHIIAVGVLVTILAACGQEAADTDRGTQAAAFELGGDAARGNALYERNCASCHGNEGRGDGPASRALNPAPADFTTKDLDAERVYTVTRDGGMAAGLAPTMPPFGGAMDDQAIRDVAAYILTMEN